MTKKLTLGAIKSNNKKFDEKLRVDINESTYVEIYPNFSPTKVNNLIKEMVTDSARAKEIGIEFDHINTVDWGLFNLIYKFADLGIPSEIKKKVEYFNELIEHEAFPKIINSFPDESIKKFEKQLSQFTDNLTAINDKNELNKVAK